MRLLIATIFLLASVSVAHAQSIHKDIPYLPDGHPRHVLDVYANANTDKSVKSPVVFWIHGGGWQAGDKSDVAIKPKYFTDKGYLFVACNYRLLPDVTMEVLTQDVASAAHWVHQNIASYGGNPDSIIIGGHSAGAQLAALLCVDDRYLKAMGTPLSAIKGCIPVDGDTYDIPKIIMTAEHRQALYGGKMPTFGHRQKFGNDPQKHIDFSTVTHIAKNKGIPPFLILYFSGNPDTTAQARRLEETLKDAEIPVMILGKHNSNHSQLNDDLGKIDDSATEILTEFLKTTR